MTVKYFMVALLLVGGLCGVFTIRVCKTFSSYYLNMIGQCTDNPNPDLTQAQIIKKWGFIAENLEITTEDGYKITVVRGYHPTKRGRSPVVFGHGIVSNGYTWIDRDKKSLPYILGNLGHEFWITNWRGTKPSRKHLNMSDTESSFWKFSFHEVAAYDLKAIMEKVYDTTNQKSIYIGMSMGTTISFIFASIYPSFADKTLSRIISLAPVAYLTDIPSILRYGVPYLDILEHFVSRNGQAFPSFEIPIQKYLCANTPHQYFLCNIVKGLVFGSNFDQLDPSTFPVTESLNYDSCSWNMIVHYSQIIKSNLFARYNYGKPGNIIRYGNKYPPLYPVENITIPVILFVGKNDYLSTKQNADRLYNKLNTRVRCGYYTVADTRWDHVDFIEATDVTTILYPIVLNVIKSNITDICTENV
ncbi:hypothetical protein GWI33_012315 [Rhynchophorus ferrugineus]|uniref:Lipase n=1 Tax=Rhynchophorus ferrugineus TaxID=354439 RepID=A0A834IW82_RHYFE|nr:hypothetical protein GWI33_012315 [Rhynchophorus ferrugineus]